MLVNLRNGMSSIQNMFLRNLLRCFKKNGKILSVIFRLRSHGVASKRDRNAIEAPCIRKWNDEDYDSLLERIQTLCGDAEDEDEVNWEALVEANQPWTGPLLRARWRELIAGKNFRNLSFQGIEKVLTKESIALCRDRLQKRII